MKRYSPEFKEAVIRKMMPPDRVASRSEFASEVENVPIMRLAEESGVSYVTLAKWREEARNSGEAAPGNGEQPDRWSSEDKFLIVLETHPLNEAEPSVFWDFIALADMMMFQNPRAFSCSQKTILDKSGHD